MTKSSYLLGVLLIVSACSVGPDYQRPDVETPASYKEAGLWVKAEPQDDIDRSGWWRIYKDPILNALEQRIDISNQNLKQAEANYRAAIALGEETRAGLFPSFALNDSATRDATTASGQSAQSTSVMGSGGVGKHRYFNIFNSSANVDWSVDLWGKIHRQVENETATAQADAADLANARLSAQAELASDYFALRVQDELQRLLDQTVADDKKILEIVNNQYHSGVVASSDVLASRTQLESAQANAIGNAVKRAQLEHAIAVLVGAAPASFALPPGDKVGIVPMIPPAVPSLLLQRRPDIAASERAVAAANANIGVAEAAYYPDLSLSGSYGVNANMIDTLFKEASTLWSFGASASETLIDFGARDAATDQARANFDASVAAYRQTVLTAFQGVEDNLAAQKFLLDQEKAQKIATDDARKSEQVSLNQYKEGIIPYNNVLTAQITRLSNEQNLLTVRSSRLAASVNLIQALGGGWDDTQLPAQGPNGFFPIPNPL